MNIKSSNKMKVAKSRLSRKGENKCSNSKSLVSCNINDPLNNEDVKRRQRESSPFSTGQKTRSVDQCSIMVSKNLVSLILLKL